MPGYRQYCPVLRSAEVFAERWTPAIVRNLLLGCHSFAEIREGAPGISRTLLTQRLRSLERWGVVERRPKPGGRGHLYHLTGAGEELEAVCDALGTWGARWLELAPEHLDAGVVLWAMCRLMDRERLPRRRVVIRFELSDGPRRRYWVLIARRQPEVCIRPPAFDDDLVVSADSESLTLWHMGLLSLSEARREGRIRIEGTPELIAAMPGWGGLSRFAGVAPAPGSRAAARASARAPVATR